MFLFFKNRSVLLLNHEFSHNRDGLRDHVSVFSGILLEEKKVASRFLMFVSQIYSNLIGWIHICLFPGNGNGSVTVFCFS